MPDVLINCSLSNAQATVFVHADDYRIYQESDGVPNCVGLWHPSGGEAKKQWVRDHPSLAEYLLKRSAVDLIEQESDGAVSEPETEDVVTEPVEPELDPEPEGAAGGKSEPEDAAAGDDPEDESGPEDTIAGGDSGVEGEVDGYENLSSLGLPDSCLDELAGAGLFTKEAILAHEDLSKIKGIGVKTRDKILAILKGE